MPNVESLEQHNLNYVKDDAFEREKKAHQEHNSDNFKFLYQEDIPHGDALDKYELTSGVDIGSGTGWFANYLIEQRKYKKVYAIEPSSSAIEIAKKIYPDNKKVKYINGFAEEEISKLKLSKPTFFSTMCCLAHLDDEDVLGILKTIDKIAPVDSVLACSEPWGDFYHRECWNISDHPNGGVIHLRIGSLSSIMIIYLLTHQAGVRDLSLLKNESIDYRWSRIYWISYC